MFKNTGDLISHPGTSYGNVTISFPFIVTLEVSRNDKNLQSISENSFLIEFISLF